MRFFKVFGITLLCLVVMSMLASASANSLGISEVAHITFDDPIRVGTTLLRAGDYEVRHVMEGQDHIMVFKRVHSKDTEVKVSCKLVPLAQRADRTATVYEFNAANEKVLRELVFRGDTAKHVF